MVNKSQTTTFSQLPPAVTIANSDIFPIQKADGLNYKVTAEELSDFIEFGVILSKMTIDVAKDWQGFVINNVGDPVQPQDVVTKAYGDANYVGVGAVGSVDIAMLSASGTPDGTTFLRGDNVWALPPDIGQTPILQDIDYDGFKILDVDRIKLKGLGTALPTTEIGIGAINANSMEFNIPINGTISFSVFGNTTFTTSQSENRFFYALNTQGTAIRFDGFDEFSTTQNIIPSAAGLEFNLPTADIYDLKIAAASEYSFSATQADFKNNNLLIGSGEIRFATATQRIRSSSGNTEYNVDVSKMQYFQVAGNNRFTIDNTLVSVLGTGGLDMTTRPIVNVGNMTLTDASDIIFDTTTGTKIGTATAQKIGFWDVTPIVQPTHIADATDAATVITQLNALLAQMAALGLQAAA